MTIQLPIRNLIVRSASDDNSVSSSSSSSSSSSFFKLRRGRSDKKKPPVTTTKKSVSFDLNHISSLPSACSTNLDDSSASLWYKRQELQQFKKEIARQLRLCKERQLNQDTDHETSWGLNLDRSLTRCKREYCYDAVIGEQCRMAKAGNCSKSEGAERIAKAYMKVQASFGNKQ